MAGSELDNFNPASPVYTGALEYALKRLKDWRGEQDPRSPVIKNVLAAIGFYDAGLSMMVDPAAVRRFKETMQARIEATTSHKAMERFGRGSFTQTYMKVAFERVFERVLDVADRELNALHGLPVTKLTKAEAYRNGNSSLLSQADWDRLDTDEKSALTAFNNETVSLRVARPAEQIAGHAQTFSSEKIAGIVAAHAIVLQMHDAFYNAAAIGGLEKKGLISDRRQGESQTVLVMAALVDDFRNGRLSEQDFQGSELRYKIQTSLGIQYQSDTDFLATLERNLADLQAGQRLSGGSAMPLPPSNG